MPDADVAVDAANFPVGKWSSLEEDGSIKLEYGGFALDVKSASSQ